MNESRCRKGKPGMQRFFYLKKSELTGRLLDRYVPLRFLAGRERAPERTMPTVHGPSARLEGKASPVKNSRPLCAPTWPDGGQGKNGQKIEDML